MRKMFTIGVLMLMLSLAAVVAFASSGGDYTLDWYTTDGGGGTSTGGSFSLSGTIGQPDAGSMSGGDYAVSGGFWVSLSQFFYDLFLPLIMR